MDFNFTEEQLQLQDAVTRFTQRDCPFEQRRAVMASADGWSPAVWKGLADLGLLALLVPEAEGGLGHGPVELMLAFQAAGPALLTEPLLASGVVATVLARDAAAGAERESLLADLAAGELIAVLAHDEAAARGEVAFVEARAVVKGGEVQLHGRKSLVLHAAAANELWVSARVSGAPTDENGVSLYRVPQGAPGLVLHTQATLDGQRAAHVVLDGVRVPASARIGGEGAALPAIERALDVGLAAATAEAVGLMAALVDATADHLRTRQQFGQPLGRFQALQHRMADMLLHLEQARSMACLAAMHCEAQDVSMRRRMLSAAKVTVGQAGRFIGQQAVQLHGGMGMTDELVVSHWFKRLLTYELSHGNTDLHLQRFAHYSQAAAA